MEGIVTCLAMIEFAGFPQLITEIEKDCQPHVDQVLRYRVCVLGKIAHLGPEYVECVLKS
ncbi:putative salivary gland protein 3 [Frankliniella occidentalis]|nr:putative salivary gland protein 3 [Frankliniella occidentalis]